MLCPISFSTRVRTVLIWRALFVIFSKNISSIQYDSCVNRTAENNSLPLNKTQPMKYKYLITRVKAI